MMDNFTAFVVFTTATPRTLFIFTDPDVTFEHAVVVPHYG
jgi:hypothetical protein